MASVSVIRLYTKIIKPNLPRQLNGTNLYPPDMSDKSKATERTGFIFFAFCGMREAETAFETLRLLTECHEDGKSTKYNGEQWLPTVTGI